jgi:hypothetical protein
LGFINYDLSKAHFFFLFLIEEAFYYPQPTYMLGSLSFFLQLGSLSWKRGPVCKCYWLQSAARHTHSFSRADERANGQVHSKITLRRP